MPRRPHILLALGCSVVAVAGCGTSPARGPRAGTITSSAVGAPQAVGVELPPAGKWFGFSDQTFLYTGWVTPELDQGVTAPRELDDVLAAGGNSERLVVPWYNVEPTPGHYDMSVIHRLKAFTDGLERAGGRVLLTLGVPPPWASAKPQDPRSGVARTPGVVRHFAAFAALVARSWPRAAAIETWNEPNTTYFWLPRGPEPERFARLHIAAARAIRRVRPHMRVLFASLLGVPADTPDVMSPRTFLRRARAAGLRGRDYDGLSLHVYPSTPGGRLTGDVTGQNAAVWRSLRDGEGPGRRHRVWVTETGLTTSGPDAVSPADQAVGVRRLVVSLLGRPDVAAVYVHTLYEPAGDPSPEDPERGYGLLRLSPAGLHVAKSADCALLLLRTVRLRAEPRCAGGG